VLHFDTWSFAAFGSYDTGVAEGPWNGGPASRGRPDGGRGARPPSLGSRDTSTWRTPEFIAVRPFVIFFSQIGGSPSIVNEIRVFANIASPDLTRRRAAPCHNAGRTPVLEGLPSNWPAQDRERTGMQQGVIPLILDSNYVLESEILETLEKTTR
jgi:hypothetical protein